MADRFVRKSGSDSNGGTSKTDAWLTIGKALGASGMSSGDVLYVGAGTYRECVIVGMTNPSAETKIIGDVDGKKTDDAGEVIWTAFTTDDQTPPTTNYLVRLDGRDFLTFQNLTMIGGSYYCIDAYNTKDAVWLTVRDCVVVSSVWSSCVEVAYSYDINGQLLLERCTFIQANTSSGGNYPLVQVTGDSGSGTGDYDTSVVVRNCLFLGLHGAGNGACNFRSTGGMSYLPGGGLVYNCTIWGFANGVQTGGGANGWSTNSPLGVFNNDIHVASGLNAANAGEMVENYNYNVAISARTNVTKGANSIEVGYSSEFEFNRPLVRGGPLRPFFEPVAGTAVHTMGNHATYTSSEDIRGFPRPAGAGSATKGVGAYARGNSGTREGTTIHAGSSSVKLLGPGYQDFEVAVPQASTTIGVYVQWDATYAGTKPSMSVLKGGEAGVSDATATATGSSGSWEQLTLNFTPTSAGIVTVRLRSSDTNGGGAAYFDDLTVT